MKHLIWIYQWIGAVLWEMVRGREKRRYFVKYKVRMRPRFWKDVKATHRMRLIDWLENKYPRRYCWAKLVLWAVFPENRDEEERSFFHLFQEGVMPKTGCGYCGKCQLLYEGGDHQ